MSTSLAALVPYRGWRRSLLGLLAALALLVAFPAATRAATVSVTTTGVDGTCARDSGSCATIAKAVEVAQSGDTILFGPGNFAANTAMITKQLTFRGSRANDTMSARVPVQRAQETVLLATGDGLHVGAEGTVIEGLVFADSPTYGLWTSGRVGDQRVGRVPDTQQHLHREPHRDLPPRRGTVIDGAQSSQATCSRRTG